MYYIEKGGKLSFDGEFTGSRVESGSVIGLFTLENMEEISNKFQMPIELLKEFLQSRTTKYENFDGFDLLSVNILDYHNMEGRIGRALIYMEKNLMLFFGDHVVDTQNMLDVVVNSGRENYSKSHALYDFFCRLNLGDRDYFDSMEKEILDLEQALITSKKKDCVVEIISLRKRLMLLKRYYEQWIDMLDGIRENENNILDSQALRYFRILSNRSDRLYQNVLNLRDYVTQVRESYEAEVDISLNATMKVFTVVTTVFLPLTLIVGWYGMNFDMPEYAWKHGYAMVAWVSVLIVIGVFAYFKKMHWF